MPRILLFVILVFAGIIPSTVAALGLGEIELKSALNQRFLAEIPVSSQSSDELTGLQVQLASADTFKRYGLVQPAFLNDFDFKVVAAGGRNFVRISSTQPVVEPFVTMLLEVKWPQGRLLREYTVLLDPPVLAAPVAPAPARPSAPPPAPAPPPPRPVQRPSQPATPVAAAPRPAPTGQPGSFGPVQRNDTLWGIASRTRPDNSIDINQMMLAIYSANPEAFDGNINRLRAGAILRIPDAAAAGGMTRQQAFAEVRRQNNEWRGAAEATPAESARLRLVPPPGAEEPPAEPAGGDAAEAASSAAADRGLQERVTQLESELADRERLLELRDQELARLQDELAQLREQELDKLVPEGAAAGEEGAPAELEEPAEPAPAEPPPVVAEPEPRPAMPPAVTTPQEEPSFIGDLLGNIWLYVGIGAALIIGLFVARRRRSEEPTGTWEALSEDVAIDEESREATDRLRAPVREAEEESFVVEETPPEESARLTAGTSTARIEQGRTGDQELPLERTLSSDAALNLDQSDPLAEAEFHSAYGLYDQAADLLNAALEVEPDRLDLRRKLIEVNFSWDNRGGFLKAAQAYHDRVGPEDAFWNKVLVMGKQLCPEEALFAGQLQAGKAGDEMDLALGDEGPGAVDLALDEGEGDVDLDLSAIREMPDDDGLDFDLGEAAEEDVDQSPTARQDSGESPTVETPTIEEPGIGARTVETPTIEQPMNEPTMETPTIETPAGDQFAGTGYGDDTAALDLDELGLDLSEFEDAAADTDDEASADDDATRFSGGLDSTAEVEQIGGELPDEEEVDAWLDPESTAEMRALEDEGEGADLDALTSALAKSTPGAETGDTVEQPKPDEVDETAEQPGPETGAEQDTGGVDFDIGEQVSDEDAPTGTMDKPSGRGPEGPTMTEVGTKLDLARAYIDMGDPEGAKSILGEVIEEGDEGQRQEAQRLLDGLSS